MYCLQVFYVAPCFASLSFLYVSLLLPSFLICVTAFGVGAEGQRAKPTLEQRARLAQLLRVSDSAPDSWAWK